MSLVFQSNLINKKINFLLKNMYDKNLIFLLNLIEILLEVQFINLKNKLFFVKFRMAIVII